jgi:hypothetical protein
VRAEAGVGSERFVVINQMMMVRVAMTRLESRSLRISGFTT